MPKLTGSERNLLESLKSLHNKLRDHTFENYGRMNPFYEDLFDWKERGRFWSGNEQVTIYNSTTIVGDVEIGSYTWIGPFCSLDGNGGLKIGSYCSISAGVQILTHDSVRWALSGGAAPYEYQSVVIGDRCFIGTHAIILKGVTIGQCSVIAAGSVVTEDVAPNSIVAGVPSRLIGSVIHAEDGSIYFKYLPNS